MHLPICHNLLHCLDWQTQIWNFGNQYKKYKIIGKSYHNTTYSSLSRDTQYLSVSFKFFPPQIWPCKKPNWRSRSHEEMTIQSSLHSNYIKPSHWHTCIQACIQHARTHLGMHTYSHTQNLYTFFIYDCVFWEFHVWVTQMPLSNDNKIKNSISHHLFLFVWQDIWKKCHTL